MKKVLMLFVVMLGLAPGVSAGQATDGSDWLGFSEMERLTYVEGYLGGFMFGTIMAPAGIGTQDPCFDKAHAAAGAVSVKYAERFAFGEVVNLVNALYLDPDNRAIELPAAVMIALKQLAGDPPAEVDWAILNSREAGKKHPEPTN